MEAQLQQARLVTQQTKEESRGKVIEAENNLAAVQSQLSQAKVNVKLAIIKQQRTQSLFAEGAVAAQQLDDINSQVEVYQANVVMVKQQVLAAQGLLVQANSALRNAPIRATAELEIKRKQTQARTDIAAAEQDVRNAQANQAHIRANLNYLLIKSPLSGSVITKIVQNGEVVASGAPLLTLVNLDHLYLRGFIPEEQIGQVKLGQKGLIYLDSLPNDPLEAIITRIDPKASFTPKNTYFKKDRVTQVFGIELTLKNPQGKAKPGMSAEGRILVPKARQKNSSNHLLSALRFLGL
jgi:HlyD family secretion protein